MSGMLLFHDDYESDEELPSLPNFEEFLPDDDDENNNNDDEKADGGNAPGLLPDDHPVPLATPPPVRPPNPIRVQRIAVAPAPAHQTSSTMRILTSPGATRHLVGTLMRCLAPMHILITCNLAGGADES